MTDRTSPPARHLLRDASALVGLLWFLVGYGLLGYTLDWFIDAQAYRTIDPVMPYGGVVGLPGTFTYSPPVAQLFVLIAWIPEPVWLAGWTAMNVGILIWLIRPWPWIGLILAAPLARELIVGQIELVMAAAIVLGFRHPWLWAVPILTKVTPGIGLLWFVARRQWRELAIGAGATGAIALASYVVAPAWWDSWFSFLRASAGGAPQQLPLVRIVIAAVLIVWAARTARPWIVPIAVVLALPVIWLHSLAMLVACVRLRSDGPPASEGRVADTPGRSGGRPLVRRD